MQIMRSGLLCRANRWLGAALLALTLAACGFQLRGLADLSFHHLMIQGPSLSISPDLRKQLKVNGVTLTNDPDKAELMMEMMNEATIKRILSLSGKVGVVREFELNYTVNFRLRTPSEETWGPVQTITGRRDFSYADSEILAKSFEEQRLYNDMRQDAVREIMRRLVVQKPNKGTTTGEPAAVVP